MFFFTWQDTTVEQQQEYRYRLFAIDSSGNKSNSAVLSGMAFDDGRRGEIYNEDGTLIQVPDAEFVTGITLGSGIIIEWDYDQLTGLRDFVVYRRRAGEPLREYKTLIVQDGYIRNPTFVHVVDPSQYVTAAFYFLDTQVTRTGSYEYRIIARHHDGGYSDLSNAITINVN